MIGDSIKAIAIYILPLFSILAGLSQFVKLFVHKKALVNNTKADLLNINLNSLCRLLKHGAWPL
jgi:hypothetical protein